MDRKVIAVVGAGPKAAALAARAWAIWDLKYANLIELPEIRVYESTRIAANWTRGGGFSDGSTTLCTPPEMDVGFPYPEWPWDGAKQGDPFDYEKSTTLPRGFGPKVWGPIAHHIRQKFSWASFLYNHDPTNKDLVDYVLRGRPMPPHQQWGDYIRWVLDGVGKQICEIIEGKVEQICFLDRPPGDAERWLLRYRPVTWKDESDQVDVRLDSTLVEHTVNAVIITGPGDPETVTGCDFAQSPAITHAGNFWEYAHEFRKIAARPMLPGESNEPIKIAVVGAGGAAATILEWLSRTLGHDNDVCLFHISSHGAFFPRGDGHAERRWMVDIAKWENQSVQVRRDFVRRISAGVVSSQLKEAMDSTRCIQFLAARVGRIEPLYDHHQRDALERAAEDGEGIAPPQMFRIFPEARDVRPSQARPTLDTDGSPDEEKPLETVHYIVMASGFDAWQLLKCVQDPGGRTAEVVAPYIRNVENASQREARRQIREEAEADLIDDRLRLRLFGNGRNLYVPSLASMRGPGFPNLGCLGLTAARILDPWIFPLCSEEIDHDEKSP